MNTGYLLPSIIGTCLGLGLAVFLGIRKPGTSWLLAVIFVLVITAWCAGQFFWVLAEDLSTAVLVNKIQYIAISNVAAFWLLLCMKETGKSHLFTPFTAALFIVPAITIYHAFSYTLGEPNALWHDYRMHSEPTIATLSYGYWFWVLAGYSYLLTSAGCLLLYVHLSQLPHYRTQLIATTSLPLFVMFLNVSHTLGLWPWKLDPTPLGYLIGFSIWGWIIYRGKWLAVTPIARKITVDSLPDCIITTNSDGIVIDYNQATKEFIDSHSPILGTPVLQMIPQLPDIFTLESPQIISKNNNQFMEVTINRVFIDKSKQANLIIVLRDVTAQKKTHALLLKTQSALEKANMELDRLAHTDELTGLANRRFLLIRMDEEMARARRLNLKMAAIFIDIDNFKSINDRFGHNFGDKVLKSIGGELLKHRKGIDIAARYGGEELILVVTNVDQQGLFKIAKRLRLSLNNLQHSYNGDNAIQVTASMGIAMLNDSDIASYDFIDRADKALYAAKENGRDCICFAKEGDFEILKT